jgi:hypothetical protein
MVKVGSGVRSVVIEEEGQLDAGAVYLSASDTILIGGPVTLRVGGELSVDAPTICLGWDVECGTLKLASRVRELTVQDGATVRVVDGLHVAREAVEVATIRVANGASLECTGALANARLRTLQVDAGGRASFVTAASWVFVPPQILVAGVLDLRAPHGVLVTTWTQTPQSIEVSGVGLVTFACDRAVKGSCLFSRVVVQGSTARMVVECHTVVMEWLQMRGGGTLHTVDAQVTVVRNLDAGHPLDFWGGVSATTQLRVEGFAACLNPVGGELCKNTRYLRADTVMLRARVPTDPGKYVAAHSGWAVSGRHVVGTAPHLVASTVLADKLEWAPIWEVEDGTATLSRRPVPQLVVPASTSVTAGSLLWNNFADDVDDRPWDIVIAGTVATKTVSSTPHRRLQLRVESGGIFTAKNGCLRAIRVVNAGSMFLSGDLEAPKDKTNFQTVLDVLEAFACEAGSRLSAPNGAIMAGAAVRLEGHVKIGLLWLGGSGRSHGQKIGTGIGAGSLVTVGGGETKVRVLQLVAHTIKISDGATLQMHDADVSSAAKVWIGPADGPVNAASRPKVCVGRGCTLRLACAGGYSRQLALAVEPGACIRVCCTHGKALHQENTVLLHLVRALAEQCWSSAAGVLHLDRPHSTSPACFSVSDEAIIVNHADAEAMLNTLMEQCAHVLVAPAVEWVLKYSPSILAWRLGSASVLAWRHVDHVTISGRTRAARGAWRPKLLVQGSWAAAQCLTLDMSSFATATIEFLPGAVVDVCGKLTARVRGGKAEVRVAATAAVWAGHVEVDTTWFVCEGVLGATCNTGFAAPKTWSSSQFLAGYVYVRTYQGWCFGPAACIQAEGPASFTIGESFKVLDGARVMAGLVILHRESIHGDAPTFAVGARDDIHRHGNVGGWFDTRFWVDTWLEEFRAAQPTVTSVGIFDLYGVNLEVLGGRVIMGGTLGFHLGASLRAEDLVCHVHGVKLPGDKWPESQTHEVGRRNAVVSTNQDLVGYAMSEFVIRGGHPRLTAGGNVVVHVAGGSNNILIVDVDDGGPTVLPFGRHEIVLDAHAGPKRAPPYLWGAPDNPNPGVLAAAGHVVAQDHSTTPAPERLAAALAAGIRPPLMCFNDVAVMGALQAALAATTRRGFLFPGVPLQTHLERLCRAPLPASLMLAHVRGAAVVHVLRSHADAGFQTVLVLDDEALASTAAPHTLEAATGSVQLSADDHVVLRRARVTGGGGVRMCAGGSQYHEGVSVAASRGSVLVSAGKHLLVQQGTRETHTRHASGCDYEEETRREAVPNVYTAAADGEVEFRARGDMNLQYVQVPRAGRVVFDSGASGLNLVAGVSTSTRRSCTTKSNGIHTATRVSVDDSTVYHPSCTLPPEAEVVVKRAGSSDATPVNVFVDVTSGEDGATSVAGRLADQARTVRVFPRPVQDVHTHTSVKTRTLTPGCAAVVGVGVAWATAGMGAAAVGATSATGVAVANAAVSAAASCSAVQLAADGRIDFEAVGRTTAQAIATAGLAQTLARATAVQSASGHAACAAVARVAVGAAVNPRDLPSALGRAVVDVVQGEVAQAIGDGAPQGGLVSSLAHAAAGGVGGALHVAVGGGSAQEIAAGAAGGAVGAAVAEGVASATNSEVCGDIAGIIAVAAVAGENGEAAVAQAARAGGIAVTRNFQAHKGRKGCEGRMGDVDDDDGYEDAAELFGGVSDDDDFDEPLPSTGSAAPPRAREAHDDVPHTVKIDAKKSRDAADAKDAAPEPAPPAASGPTAKKVVASCIAAVRKILTPIAATASAVANIPQKGEDAYVAAKIERAEAMLGRPLRTSEKVLLQAEFAKHFAEDALAVDQVWGAINLAEINSWSKAIEVVGNMGDFDPDDVEVMENLATAGDIMYKKLVGRK